ncbi:FCD domain-containing protein [Herminiimonas sp. CN]|uniref:FCD domain-containing protein n=1 Tax=Herminiimonas sp. CN TaxID=1349818 RepID=UPI0004739C1F|nr:FCD domain-containing protein [Herminiimonas sp. CN]
MHSQKFKTAFTDPDAPPRTLAEGAYLQVRCDIIEGRLAPGEKLRVEHLKDRYGIGAGTLREALALLLSDVLVVAEGQRGFHVAPISLQDLADITHTRVLLETNALRQSIRNGDDEWEARLVAAFHKLSNSEERLDNHSNVREWEARNRGFHEALIAACDSPWQCYLIGLLYRQSERYRHLAITRKAMPRDVHAEHAAIIEAALKRDAERASRALEQHIRLTFDSIRLLAPALSASQKSV